MNELTKSATDYIDAISNPILFDEVLRDKDRRDKKVKCSKIFGFTTRTLTPEECIKFEIDSLKKYQMITSIENESIALISGLKIGDIGLG